MLAEIKTSVKSSCILSFGKAPNSTINNIIPCNLSVLCHWYVILSLSGFLNLISSLTETQASSPTFLQKAIWYKWTKRKKGPHFLCSLSFKKWGLACQLLGKPAPLLPREAESRAGSNASPCKQPAAVCNSRVLHTPWLMAVEIRSLSSPATLPESGGPLGAFLQANQADEQSDCHLLWLVPTL